MRRLRASKSRNGLASLPLEVLPASARRHLPDSAADILPSKAKRALATIYPSKARPAFWWEADRARPDYGVSDRPDWRTIDWPGVTRQVTVAGRSVNYVELGSGDGAPAVFVHGLGGNWQNWLEALPRVARERRVLAMDLPGFGASDMPADMISITNYARIVEEFCARLELGSVSVVGNSMGGFIGAEMAISHPHRVERLCLAAAAGISSSHARRAPTLTIGRLVTAFGTVTLAQADAVVARPRARHLVLSGIVRHPTRLAPDLTYEIMLGTNKPGYIPALDALLHYDFRDRLPEIQCPTLLVWGEEDILVPVADADEYERLIPSSRKILLDDTGHVPMLERPATFNDGLLGFLAEPAGSAGGQPAAAVGDRA